MANEFFKNAIKHDVEVDIKQTAPPVPKEPPPEKTFEKAIDTTTNSDAQKSYEESVPANAKVLTGGIAGDNLVEPLPKFIEAPCEVIYQSKNGSFIVLGRDRPGSRLSGYGGQGDTKCASIDIVVGRCGFEAGKVNEMNEQLFVEPSFKKDAARIYLSQKTDIDTNFELADGSVGNSKTKSGIALKADGVRIIAREGIKLVTGTDKMNSHGGACRSIQGIDLIAGNDDGELQSIPKGENLKEALERMTHHIDSLAGLVDTFLHIQMEYNAHIASHWHTSPFFAVPTLHSEVLIPEGAKCAMNQLVKVKRGLLDFKVNLASFQVSYLNVYGKQFINSRYNKVN